MKLLLDTHPFLWWDSAPSRLSDKAQALLTDAGNVVLLSVVSVWEVQVKSQLGKLSLRLPLSVLIDEQRSINRVDVLPVTLQHVLMLEVLPLHHKDPFDRLLIAQALSEQATIVTKDSLFMHYAVQTCW